MRLLILMGALSMFNIVQAQNVGIGTSNPQQKLHVAGNVRIDGMAGANGLVVNNTGGDLSTLALNDDTNQVLLSTGTWGRLNGTVPPGTLVASTDGNNINLLQRGFRLFGFLPGVSTYNTSTITGPANTWSPTYVEGVAGKYNPPNFDGNKIFCWVDSVMYVFSENSFYIYNPVTDTWRFGFINPTAFQASSGCQMVYTGTELIVWGGNYSTAANNGFRYNPSADSWAAIPSAGQPSARSQFGMQLINNKLIVWGGISPGGAVLGDGAVLDLATNTWSAINAAGAPSARRDFLTVTNGLQNNMIIWGGYTASSITGDGAIYNPASNTWSPVTNVNAPIPRNGATAVWSGTEMIVFGGNGPTTDLQYLNTGAKYNPVADTWTATSTAGAPRVERHAAIWTGSHMLISGGNDNIFNIIGAPWSGNSYRYDPAADSWQSAGFMGTTKATHVMLMADNMILAFGGNTSVRNSITLQNSFTNGTPHGSRYFLAPTNTSQTLLASASKLYLYIKE